jgi:hypothetical protein
MLCVCVSQIIVSIQRIQGQVIIKSFTMTYLTNYSSNVAIHYNDTMRRCNDDMIL